MFFIPQKTISVLALFLEVASRLGEVVTQLIDGHISSIDIGYDGEIANSDVIQTVSQLILVLLLSYKSLKAR